VSGPQAFGQDALAEADGDFHEGRLTHPRRHWTGLKAGVQARSAGGDPRAWGTEPRASRPIHPAITLLNRHNGLAERHAGHRKCMERPLDLAMPASPIRRGFYQRPVESLGQENA